MARTNHCHFTMPFKFNSWPVASPAIGLRIPSTAILKIDPFVNRLPTEIFACFGSKSSSQFINIPQGTSIPTRNPDGSDFAWGEFQYQTAKPSSIMRQIRWNGNLFDYLWPQGKHISDSITVNWKFVTAKLVEDGNTMIPFGQIPMTTRYWRLHLTNSSMDNQLTQQTTWRQTRHPNPQ